MDLSGLIAEAIEELRAFCEPPLLDRLDDVIHAKVEFDLTTKQDRQMDEFSKMVPIAHPYRENAIEKAVCVFAADPEQQELATEAGATLVGGEELITDITKGRVEMVSIYGAKKFSFSYFSATLHGYLGQACNYMCQDSGQV